MSLLLGQACDDTGDRRVRRHAERRAHRRARHVGPRLREVHRVVNHLDFRRVRVHLRDVEVANRRRRHDHAVGAGHQQPLDDGVVTPLVLVDVHFGAHHDRYARQNRREAPVQARGQQERVDDLRLRLPQVRADARHVEGTAHARLETEDVDGRAGRPNLLADRPRLVNAAHHWLESRRQVAHQVQHHFLGTADHERMRKVNNTNATRTLNAQLSTLTVG